MNPFKAIVEVVGWLLFACMLVLSGLTGLVIHYERQLREPDTRRELHHTPRFWLPRIVRRKKTPAMPPLAHREVNDSYTIPDYFLGVSTGVSFSEMVEDSGLANFPEGTRRCRMLTSGGKICLQSMGHNMVRISFVNDTGEVVSHTITAEGVSR